MQNTIVLWHFPFSAERGVFSFEEKRMFQDGESAPKTPDAPKPVAATQTEAPAKQTESKLQFQETSDRKKVQDTKTALANLKGKIDTNQKFADLSDEDKTKPDEKITDNDIQKFHEEFTGLKAHLDTVFQGDNSIRSELDAKIKALENHTVSAEKIASQLQALLDFLNKYETALTSAVENTHGFMEIPDTMILKSKKEITGLDAGALKSKLQESGIGEKTVSAIHTEFTQTPVNSMEEINVLKQITKLVAFIEKGNTEELTKAKQEFPWLKEWITQNEGDKNFTREEIKYAREQLYAAKGGEISRNAQQKNDESIQNAIKNSSGLLSIVKGILGENLTKSLLENKIIGQWMRQFLGVHFDENAKKNIGTRDDVFSKILERDQAKKKMYEELFAKPSKEIKKSISQAKNLLKGQFPEAYTLQDTSSLKEDKKPTADLLQDIFGRFNDKITALQDFKEPTQETDGEISIVCKTPVEALAIARFYAPNGKEASIDIKTMMNMFGGKKDDKKTEEEKKADGIKKAQGMFDKLKGSDPYATSKENLPVGMGASVENNVVHLSWHPISPMDRIKASWNGMTGKTEVKK